jgi:hypothetical protein
MALMMVVAVMMVAVVVGVVGQSPKFGQSRAVVPQE